ncbi:MAG: hypothetical protein ACN6I5_04000 [Hyphomicrobiales bacterium]
MLMGVTLQIGIALCVFIESGMTSMGVWPGIFLLDGGLPLFPHRLLRASIGCGCIDGS